MTYTLTTKKPVSVIIGEETTDFNQIALATLTNGSIGKKAAHDLLESYIASLDTIDNNLWTVGARKELIYSEGESGSGADGQTADVYLIFKHFGSADSPKIVQFKLENVTTSNLLSKVTSWSTQTFNATLLLTEYLCTCAIFELR